MTLRIPPSMTVEGFDAFALLPENRERLLEFIAGEVVEVVSGGVAPEIGVNISTALKNYVRQNKLARITGADGGFQVGNERYIPDVGVVLIANHPERTEQGYKPYPPDLAVEVISPTDREKDIRIKLANYLRAGCIVWIVDPAAQMVEVYVPNQEVQILGIGDTLTGGNLLPDFNLPVQEIFED